MSIEEGWPSMAVLLRSADAQPKTPSALTIVVCESVPTTNRDRPQTCCRRHRANDRARYSRFTWWQMPVSGGTT